MPLIKRSTDSNLKETLVLADLNKSLKINPNGSSALRVRESTYHMMGKYKESFAGLNRSLEIEPNDALALRQRETIYYMMNRYEEALKDLKKSLEIEPNDAITLRQYGDTSY